MTKSKKQMTEIIRCPWTGDDSLYHHYHDTEWGRPNGDDQALFEKLCLEGFQAGLSWITVLRKREHLRKVFDQFDPEKLARLSDKKIEKLLQDPGIIRNRLKVEATKSNALAYLKLRETKSLGAFLWDFVDGQPIQNALKDRSEFQAETPISQKMSKELKRLGFKFCGPTIMYAFMQSMGFVNDHIVSCHFYQPCVDAAKKFKAPSQ